MKTLELIRCPEAELTPHLRQMKLKELEKHGENLVRILGGKSYAAVLSKMIKAVPQLDDSGERFQVMQQLLQPELPQAVALPDVLAKLTVILVLVVRLKFNDIHDKR